MVEQESKEAGKKGKELRLCPVCGEDVPPAAWLYHPHSPAKRQSIFARPWPSWVWAIRAINFLIVLLIVVVIAIASLCSGGPPGE